MQKLVDYRFSNLDIFLDEVRAWDLDFRLIKQGGFSGHLIQVAYSDIFITYARFMTDLHQMGSTPPGFRTFAIPGPRCQGFWWRNQQISSDCLMIFPSSNELMSVSSEDFEVFTISLSHNYIDRISDQLDIQPKLVKEVIVLDHQRANELRSLAQRAIESGNALSNKYTQHNLAQKVLSCCTGDTKTTAIRKRKRDHAIMQIIEYLASNPAEITDSSGLCRVANVSERTLQYAFMERYGIPPNVFVKRWKLNSARRLLRLMAPECGSVAEVCDRFGFLYPSQFTQEYKDMFAELPSKTLSRKC